MEMKQGNILLESGTNELEILIFSLLAHKPGESPDKAEVEHYGINVAKVREIIKRPETTAMPNQAACVDGVVNIRGAVIPMIDLAKAIGYEGQAKRCSKAIITEFNNFLNGFLVHDVDRIYRVSWELIEPPAGCLQSGVQECVTSIVRWEEKVVMMLDFEKIVFEINPHLFEQGEAPEKSAGSANVLVAEDSSFFRAMIAKYLGEAGYGVVQFENGSLALDHLAKLASSARDGAGELEAVDAIVTDIEMPKMDGLHLIRRIREMKEYAETPIIVFSSLANTENVRKWESLGANGYITKPDLARLAEVVAKHLE